MQVYITVSDKCLAVAIPCGWLHPKALISIPADRGYHPLLIDVPAPPLRHGPATAGPGVLERSGARRHGQGPWRHLTRRSEAEAVLKDKGGGAAQGAHPPPGPPDGQASTKPFLASTVFGRTVGAAKRRATMVEAPQTCSGCGRPVIVFLCEHPFWPQRLYGCTRGRSAGAWVQRKGRDKLPERSVGTLQGSAPAAEHPTLPCQYSVLQRGRWFGARLAKPMLTAHLFS